jgi:hypothetical protein
MIDKQPAVQPIDACSEGVENTQNKTVPEKVVTMNADLIQKPEAASGHVKIEPATTCTDLMPLDRDALKARCPLPILLKRIGLGKYAKKSCRSPLRDDEKPSWGIFEKDGRWFWKDLGTGESGDEIDFLAQYFGKDVKKDFVDLLKFYAVKAQQPEDDEEVMLKSKISGIKKEKPDCSGFHLGSELEVQRITQTRMIKQEALEWAQSRGVLMFGTWFPFGVYAITDITRKAMALRRLDGKMFPAGEGNEERKAHLIKNSVTDWPLGIIEANDCEKILLLEGVPDFLAAHQVIMDEKAKDKVGPVCMLAAGIDIDSKGLPYFKCKQVRIVAHVDKPGIEAAVRWQKQLLAAGSGSVGIVDLSKVEVPNGIKIKDLNDFLPYHNSTNRLCEQKCSLVG